VDFSALELTNEDKDALNAFAAACVLKGMTPDQIIFAFKATRPLTLQFAKRYTELIHDAIDGLGARIHQTDDVWTAGFLGGLAAAMTIVDHGPDAADQYTPGFMAEARAAILASMGVTQP
jgi:hypothetical protein